MLQTEGFKKVSKFIPRYNKKFTMVSCLQKHKTYISAVEGLKCCANRIKMLKFIGKKIEIYCLNR